MVSLLLEVGLKDDSATQSLDDVEESKWMDKGWTELHVATTFDQTGEIKRLVKIGKHETLDCKDKDDRSLLFLTPSKGFESCVKVLARAGANVDAKRNDGCTILYRVAAKGDSRMVKVLVELGGGPSIVADQRNRSAIDVARDEGREIVEILEQREEVLHALRRGDIMLLESLLEKDSSVEFIDQRTSLYMAVVGSYNDTVKVGPKVSFVNSQDRYIKTGATRNSDFSSNTIISMKLIGFGNYRVWVAAMKLAINTRNKTGFIDVFQPIMSSLLSRENLPDVKDAFGIIFREESHRGIASSSSGSVSKPRVSNFVAKSIN
ncbi:ankyrin repeat-containing protein [Tanacetum coccineum]